MITERDKEVIGFITKCPCYSDTIQELFYPSVRVANRRLELMTDYKYIRRFRERVNDKYFYYTGRKPKQLEHMDLAARTLIWIKQQGYKVLEFKREVKFDGARPDAVIGIYKNGKYGVVVLEVERFNNSLERKISIYERILREGKLFNTFKILYICNKTPPKSDIDIITLGVDKIRKR